MPTRLNTSYEILSLPGPELSLQETRTMTSSRLRSGLVCGADTPPDGRVRKRKENGSNPFWLNVGDHLDLNNFTDSALIPHIIRPARFLISTFC